MKTYTINFQTGAEPITGQYEDLAAVKADALERMGFTQQSVEIFDEAGELVTRSQWFSGAASEQDIEMDVVLVQFGTEGYYARWDDELNDYLF